MGKIKNAFKSLSPLDIISIATATPLSAAADPMRPLNKLQEIINPSANLESPSAPPAAPTLLTEETGQTDAQKQEALKRKKATGRFQAMTSGALGDVSTYKPTLLGQ